MYKICLFRSVTSSGSSMGEAGEGKSMSYASIVSPGGATLSPGGGGGAQPEAAVEAKEIVVAEEAHPPVDDDLEGFQEVETAMKFCPWQFLTSDLTR